MVGRHPLEVVILGSSPSPATKYLYNLFFESMNIGALVAVLVSVFVAIFVAVYLKKKK